MTVSAGAFVAEIPGIDPVALAHELHPLLGGDLVAIDRLVAAVPHRKDDAPLGGAVDLHAEVAPVPSAGHVEGGDRFLHGGHLAVEGRDGVGGSLVAQVDRGGVASLLEVEMSAIGGGAVEDQRLEVAGVPSLRIQGFETEILITGAFDDEGAEVGGLRIGGRPSAHHHLAKASGHRESQLGFGAGRQPQPEPGLQGSRSGDAAVPVHGVGGIGPTAHAVALGNPRGFGARQRVGGECGYLQFGAPHGCCGTQHQDPPHRKGPHQISDRHAESIPVVDAEGNRECGLQGLSRIWATLACRSAPMSSWNMYASRLPPVFQLWRKSSFWAAIQRAAPSMVR